MSIADAYLQTTTIPLDTHLHIGSLLFEGVDQIDLTGPFEVLSILEQARQSVRAITAQREQTARRTAATLGTVPAAAGK